MTAAVVSPGQREAWRSFVDQELVPRAAHADATEAIPAALLDRLAEAGLWGALLPTQTGGLGLTMRAVAALHEEIGRGCSSVRALLGAHGLVSWAVHRWGSQAQRETWLPLLATGEQRAAFCLTEPEQGSDASRITATASATGSGWVLEATKIWVTGGAVAGLLLVFARTDRGISAFLVPANTAGVQVEPRSGLLGVRASMTADITLRRCTVPAQALLGPEGFALPTVITSALDIGRLSVAAGCGGILHACLDASISYAGRRGVGDGRLADRQLAQRMIANMATDLAAARLLCDDAARLKDSGDPETIAATWRAKYFASTTAARAASDAVQLHGASGCVMSSTVARCYRDVKIMEIIEGSTEIQQLVIAGEVIR